MAKKKNAKLAEERRPADAAPEFGTTQRAYTMRLSTNSDGGYDATTLDALWATHEAVNEGVKAFGDWLLTLRGGLDHGLADKEIVSGKSKRTPTPQERRDRRILLALSWLSVESKQGSPAKFLVKHDFDATAGRRSNWRACDALKDILLHRGLSPDKILPWIDDCAASLKAAIRPDAVWVNRSAAFDAATADWLIDDARTDARTLLWAILGDGYLSMPKREESDSSDTSDEDAEDEASPGEDERQASSKGAGQKTRHPFSHIFGTSASFGNKPQRSLKLRLKWKGYLQPRIKEAGIPLCGRDARTELHRLMFSEAAAKLAQIWTKQRRQEVQRQERAKADEKLKAMEQDASFTEALSALNGYCRRFGMESGAIEEFRIRPVQIRGWKDVVARWAVITEADPDMAQSKRIEAMRALQLETEGKPGDPNLFSRLAGDDYRCIWEQNGTATPEILAQFVIGTQARADAARLKVASYRHPDMYESPVFCQFGNSKPGIDFERLATPEKRADRRQLHLLLWHPNEKCAKKTALFGLSRRFDKEIGAAEALDAGVQPRPAVSRRGRLSAAAAGADPRDSSAAKVLRVFDPQPTRPRANGGQPKLKKAEWNGKLLANRRELAAIGKLARKAENGMPPKEAADLRKRVENRRMKLRWQLSISLELACRGPWHDYIQGLSDKTPFLRTAKEDGKKAAKGSKYISWAGWPWEEVNKPLKISKNAKIVEDRQARREGHAKLLLCRLPGLRLLSVDLGIRCAAACAVWETMTSAQVEGACRAAGGQPPAAEALYLHLKQPDSGRTTVFRRVGPDSLPDGKPHPAPWARLERQFLINLPGEGGQTREASNEEIWKLHELEAKLGRRSPLIDRMVRTGFGITDKQKQRLEALRRLGWAQAPSTSEPRNGGSEAEGDAHNDAHPSRSAADLMVGAARTLRQGLRRHGDRARIAFSLKAENRLLPGDREESIAATQKKTETRVSALINWRDYCSKPLWRDEWSERLWNERVAPLLPGAPLPDAPREETLARAGGEYQQKLAAALRPAAETLREDDFLALSDLWASRWREDDNAWPRRLRDLYDWVFPRVARDQRDDDEAARKEKKRRRAGVQHVGGLSFDRINAFTQLYGLLKAYAMRPEPGEPRKNIPEDGDDSLTDFHWRLLRARDRLREQRIKQLASRIAEAALGVGREHLRADKDDPEACWCGKVHANSNKWKQWKRPRVRQYAPCHAVVIENLSGYGTDESRLRAENRRLMEWSKGKIKKYLAEACRLHGLHLREVIPNYTSRQDSRTGAAGLRCEDVPLKVFASAPWWRKRASAAEKRKGKSQAGPIDAYILELNQQWAQLRRTRPKGNEPEFLRIPAEGGPIFVSSAVMSDDDKKRNGPPGMHADLNAAANIGLRAILDPDWAGRWWYVPCKGDTTTPDASKIKGSAVFTNAPQLGNGSQPTAADPSATTLKNRWRDPSHQDIRMGDWKPTAPYWRSVEERIVSVLRKNPPPKKRPPAKNP